MLFELREKGRGRRGRRTGDEVGCKNNSYSFIPTSPTSPTSIISLIYTGWTKKVSSLSPFFSLLHVQNEVGGVGEVGRQRLIFLYFLPQKEKRGRNLPLVVGTEASL